MLRALPLFLLAFLLHACTSPATETARRDSAASVGPARITLVVYRDNFRLTLVNEAHGELVEFNSQLRENANTKISYNELVEGVIGYYEENGFFDLAIRGRAPLEARTGAAQAIEVESPRGTYFLMPDQGMTPEQIKTFNEFRQLFIEAYNFTPQLQSVVNPEGEKIFEQHEQSNKNRR